MITTTTDSIDGRKVAGYLGIVSGAAVMGTNVFRDFFAGITDILGGRSGGYEKELRKADRKSTRLELQSLMRISYAVSCLKKHKEQTRQCQKVNNKNAYRQRT